MRFDLIIVDSMSFLQKGFLKLITHEVRLTYVLSFPHLRLSDGETMRRFFLKRCSLVKEERPSYFILLCGVLAMTSYQASKEPVGKCITL